ncbi:MAG: glycosyltransferase [Acidobacteria bacterium]|nr:glycosyltransferase [Acidobacteriota bacterium]
MSAPILHVAPFLWSGAGKVITALASSQARRGPVVVVTTGRHEALGDWPTYRRALTRAGVRHVAIDTFHRDASTVWSSAARLAALLTELRPRVVHGHAGMPTGIVALARDIAGSRVRLVGQMYSWGPDRPGWMDSQDLWAFRQADLVVSSARAYSRRLREGGVLARRLVYLPWGLDLTALPFRAAADTPDGPPVVGFVGRIEPRKNQLALVEAFAKLRRAVPGARLELIGPIADDGYARQLTAVITRLGLGQAVRVTGQVPDVARLVRRWALFASLSADEGQGLAVLEAMALGVPVVARRVAGVEDFLTGGHTGWVSAGASAAAIAAEMRDALTDRHAAVIVRRARQMVERRYDWAVMAGAFERLYRGRGRDARGRA